MPECDGYTSNLKHYRPLPIARIMQNCFRTNVPLFGPPPPLGLGIIFLLSNLGLLPLNRQVGLEPTSPSLNSTFA
jgi:hypothetical protein